uniref:Uncharacterized protein n=1 Tax=Angiostrongylus cantonensis TaxID=6313 RepID=A0A0K0D2H0_ANGCA
MNRCGITSIGGYLEQKHEQQKQAHVNNAFDETGLMKDAASRRVACSTKVGSVLMMSVQLCSLVDEQHEKRPTPMKVTWQMQA